MKSLSRRFTLRALVIFVITAVVVTLMPMPAQAVPPGTPTDLAATRGAGNSVSVTWTPLTPDTSADEYTVKAYTTQTGNITWDACSASPGSARTCEGLDSLNIPRTSDGWVEVTAELDNVAGAPTPTRVRVLAYPGAPTGVSTVAADGALSVSWLAPTTGAAPTEYTATAYSLPSGGAVVGSSCTTSTSSCDVTGLTNGTTYFIEVVARCIANATCSSESVTFDRDSDPSIRVSGVPQGRPTVPASVDVLGGDSIITVSWAAPASDGGSPITNYLVEAFTSASGGTPVDTCNPSTVASMRCVLEGLNNGTSYYVQVSAQNIAGSSPVSSRQIVQPGARATAPRSVEVLRGDGTLGVTWTASISDGGSSITSYTAQAYTSSLSSSRPVASCSTSTLMCVISGVTNSTTYYVNVFATTAVGTGPPSARVTSRASAAPSSPREVKAPRADGYSRVSWRAPSALNGSIITNYIVRAYRTIQGGEIFATCEPKKDPGSINSFIALECDLGPLPNGTTYYVDVVAVTSLFTSEASSPRVSVLTATTPEVPREVTATQANTGVKVRWKVPITDGGLPISRYTATAYSSAISEDPVGSCSTRTDSCEITDVTGPPLYIDVTATTSAGSSAPTKPRVRVVIYGAPTEPREVSAQRSGPRVVLSWLRSIDDGDTPVTVYTAEVSDATDRLLGSCQVLTPRGTLDTRVSCTVKGLSRKAVGVATITAKNATASTSSDPIRVPAQSGLLAEPRELVVYPSERSLAVTSQRAPAEGTSTVYRYRAWTQSKGGRILATCASPQSRVQPACVIRDLPNYQPVWIDAIAEQNEAKSKATPRIEASPRASVPTPPMNVTVAIKGTDAIVRWQSPLSDGGYPIQNSIVTAYAGTQLDPESIIGKCTAKKLQNKCTLTGISAAYISVSVAAVNPVGVGSSSAPLGRNVTANHS